MKEYKYKINGQEYTVVINQVEDNIAQVSVNGKDYEVELPKEEAPAAPKQTHVSQEEPAATAQNDAAVANAQSTIKAPLPGVITEISVAVGDKVKRGDTLLVLEAMKMANNIEAEADGEVLQICVKTGQNVMEDTTLVLIG